MENKVYIVNAAKYSEGETIGAWFTLPIDVEELKERLFLDDGNSGYVIHDYNLLFDIDDYIEIEELNRLCVLSEKLEGTPVEHEIKAVQNYFFSSFEELCKNVDNIKHYNYDNMTDVARYLILEKGELGEIPIFLRDYIHYESYGRDLELFSSDFLVTAHGVFEYKGN